MSIWSDVSLKADIFLLIFHLHGVAIAVLGPLPLLCFCQFLPLVPLVAAFCILVLAQWVHIN